MFKQRVKGEITTPNAVLALMDKIGPTKAAKEIGTSTTTLYKARKSSKVSRVFEVAAQGILAHNGAAPKAEAPKKRGRPVTAKHAGNGKTELMLLEVPAGRAEFVRRVAEKVGASEVL